jgi:hypothetical protein
MPQASHSTHPSNPVNAKRLAAVILVLLPILATYGILFGMMRNVPLLDDYHAVLEFLLTLKQLPTLGSKLTWIVAAQHSEYKLIFEHTLIAAQFALTGHVHFEFLIVLGDLMMLGMVWFLWRNYFADEPDLTLRLFLFAPIGMLILQLNYVDTLNWAMCGLQTIPVNMFALATIHYLIRSTRRDFALACFCAVLASFSSVNGFLLAPVGLLILLPRRRWGQIAAWTATLCIAFALYMVRYTFITLADHGDHVPLLAKLQFFLLFLGGAAENQHRFPVKNAALVLGLLIVALFAWACRKRFDRTHPFAFYTTVWVMLTAAIVAQGRSGGGIVLSLTGRYKIYSDLLLIFCYLILADTVRRSTWPVQRKRQLYAVTLLLVALLCAASDFLGYKLLAKRDLRVANGLNQFEADPATNSPEIKLPGEDKDVGEAPPRARVILNEALAAGIYKLPPPSKR